MTQVSAPPAPRLLPANLCSGHGGWWVQTVEDRWWTACTGCKRCPEQQGDRHGM